MNLKVKAGSRITFVMPDGVEMTWETLGDTDTSHLIDTVARFETSADVEIESQP